MVCWSSLLTITLHEVCVYVIPYTGMIEYILQAYSLFKEIVIAIKDALQKHKSNGSLTW